MEVRHNLILCHCHYGKPVNAGWPASNIKFISDHLSLLGGQCQWGDNTVASYHNTKFMGDFYGIYKVLRACVK